MTSLTADLLERGRAEGEAKGRAEGREKERYHQISGMLKRGKTPEEISEFCGYSMSLVLEVRKAVEGGEDRDA